MQRNKDHVHTFIKKSCLRYYFQQNKNATPITLSPLLRRSSQNKE